MVDWIDACKQRRLDDLLNLYDPWATVECCSGGRFKVDPRWNDTGSPGWLVRRLMHSRFDALTTDPDGVTLDYLGYDGFPMRTHFRFTSTGKISLTACMPIRAAA